MIAFLKHLFLYDVWLKLFSLALAILIWLTISFAIRKEYSPSPLPTLSPYNAQRVTYVLPVVVLSSAEDPRSFKVDPKEVQVTVEADPKRLESLQSKEIRALVDLSGIEAANDLLKRIEISTPPGVTHVRVFPQEVKVIIPPKS
jgi:hypothetical protein